MRLFPHLSPTHLTTPSRAIATHRHLLCTIDSLSTPTDLQHYATQLCTTLQHVYTNAFDVDTRATTPSAPPATPLTQMQSLCRTHRKLRHTWFPLLRQALLPMDTLWRQQHPTTPTPPWYTLRAPTHHLRLQEIRTVCQEYVTSKIRWMIINPDTTPMSEIPDLAERNILLYAVMCEWVHAGMEPALPPIMASLADRCYTRLPSRALLDASCPHPRDLSMMMYRILGAEAEFQSLVGQGLLVPQQVSSSTSKTPPTPTGDGDLSLPHILRPNVHLQLADWFKCSYAVSDLDSKMEGYPIHPNSEGRVMGSPINRPVGGWYWPELRIAFHTRDIRVVRSFYRKWITEWHIPALHPSYTRLSVLSTPPPNEPDSAAYPFSLYRRKEVFRCYIRDVIRQTEWTPDRLCEYYRFLKDTIYPEGPTPCQLHRLYREVGHDVYTEMYLNHPDTDETDYCEFLYDVVHPVNRRTVDVRVDVGDTYNATQQHRWDVWKSLAIQVTSIETVMQVYIDHHLKSRIVNHRVLPCLDHDYMLFCSASREGDYVPSLVIARDMLLQWEDMGKRTRTRMRPCCPPRSPVPSPAHHPSLLSVLLTATDTLYAIHRARWAYPAAVATTSTPSATPTTHPLPEFYYELAQIVDHQTQAYSTQNPDRQLQIHPQASMVTAAFVWNVWNGNVCKGSATATVSLHTIIPTRTHLFGTYTHRTKEPVCSICYDDLNQTCTNLQCFECLEKQFWTDECDGGSGGSGGSDRDPLNIHDHDAHLHMIQQGACGHEFHGCCILTWLDQQESQGNSLTCPMCRTPWSLATREPSSGHGTPNTCGPYACCRSSSDGSHNSNSEEDYEDDDTLAFDTRHPDTPATAPATTPTLITAPSPPQDNTPTICMIRAPMHLMNLLMWIAVSDTVPLTTLSQLVYHQPTPSKTLLADIETLCATQWVDWVDREQASLPTLKWCTAPLLKKDTDLHLADCIEDIGGPILTDAVCTDAPTGTYRAPGPP